MQRTSIVLLTIGLLLASAAVRATPLDAEACGKLKSEQGQLEQAGARGNMMKGPEWARLNLAADKLDQIKRLVEIDEQLLFRCHGKPLVALPADVEADPASTGKDAAKTAPASKTPEKKKTPAKKAVAHPSAAAEAKPDAATAKAHAVRKSNPATKTPSPPPSTVAKAKPKPKPKVDDAYRPPSSDANARPTDGQSSGPTK